MKPIVYIERQPDEPMMEHCLAAWQGFKWDGYEVRFFLPLTEDSFSSGPRAAVWTSDAIVPRLEAQVPVVGSVASTQLLFSKKIKQIPTPLNVPTELMRFAGRSIERTTLGVVLNGKFPVFIKPADACKLFTGGVITNPVNARLFFSDIPDDTPVLASSVVQFESEFRVFVNRNREIVDMKHYQGDPFIVPNQRDIKTLIAAYTDAPCSYSLDVGVVNHMGLEVTVVVECNDFWSLGTYGMDPVAYSRMLAQRWHEIITNF